jgi:DNA-binding MarR family transcriptional regulator
MCLDVSTISRHLHSLELQDMVARTSDPLDARAQRVSLTARGIEVLARLREHRAATIRAATTGWPESDRDGLARLLRRLAEDLSQILSPCAPGATDEPARTELTPKATALTEEILEKL